MFDQFAFVERTCSRSEPVRQEEVRRRREDVVKKADVRKTDASLLGGGKRSGPGTLGVETDPSLLVARWQSMASGAKTVELRRFYVLVGIVLAPQNASSSARKALDALRESAKKEGHDDLTPAFLSRLDTHVVSDLIKMCNYRNNKAKYLVDIATTVRLNMGRVATTRRGYQEYRGVGKELAALLMLVNTQQLAVQHCAAALKDTTTKSTS